MIRENHQTYMFPQKPSQIEPFKRFGTSNDQWVVDHQTYLHIYVYICFKKTNQQTKPTSGHVGVLGSWGGGFHHPTIGSGGFFSYDVGTLWNLSFPSKALTDRTLQKWVKWMHGIVTSDNFSIGEHLMNLYVFDLGYRMGKIKPTSGHVGALGSWGGGFHDPTIGSGVFFFIWCGNIMKSIIPLKGPHR